MDPEVLLNLMLLVLRFAYEPEYAKRFVDAKVVPLVSAIANDPDFNKKAKEKPVTESIYGVWVEVMFDNQTSQSCTISHYPQVEVGTVTAGLPNCWTCFLLCRYYWFFPLYFMCNYSF